MTCRPPGCRRTLACGPTSTDLTSRILMTSPSLISVCSWARPATGVDADTSRSLASPVFSSVMYTTAECAILPVARDQAADA